MKSGKFSKSNESDGQSEFELLLESSFSYTPPRRGEIRNAIILQIETREIIVDMGAKQDGIVPAQDIERLDAEVRGSLAVGAEVPVYVLNPRDQDDNLIVSINMGLQQYDWEKDIMSGHWNPAKAEAALKELPAAKICDALLNRLRHQCHTVRIDGPSLREPQG